MIIITMGDDKMNIGPKIRQSVFTVDTRIRIYLTKHSAKKYNHNDNTLRHDNKNIINACSL